MLDKFGFKATDPTPNLRELLPQNIHLQTDWEEIHGAAMEQIHQQGLLSAYEYEIGMRQVPEDLSRDKDAAAIRFMRGNGVEVTETREEELTYRRRAKVTGFATEMMGRAGCRPDHPRRRGESPPPGAGGSGSGGGGGCSFGTGDSYASASQYSGFGSQNYGQPQQGGYQGYSGNQTEHN